eukprot:scaffold4545_cov111-Isochrysis_galbana.AAC.17
MNTRLWCSASSGSFRRPGPWQVYETGDAGGRAMTAHLPDVADPLRPFPPCFEVALSPQTRPDTRRSSLPGAISRRY